MTNYPLPTYVYHQASMSKIAELEELQRSYKTIEQIEDGVAKWKIT
jgi:hypothetical protein